GSPPAGSAGAASGSPASRSGCSAAGRSAVLARRMVVIGSPPPVAWHIVAHANNSRPPERVSRSGAVLHASPRAGRRALTLARRPRRSAPDLAPPLRQADLCASDPTREERRRDDRTAIRHDGAERGAQFRFAGDDGDQIGRASCRERKMRSVAVVLDKTKI